MSEKPKDRVEREVLIHAPVERVYAALTDTSLYPTWGPQRVEGELLPGERPIFDFGPAGGGKVAVYVVAVDPPDYFAYRWAQGETDPARVLEDPLQRPNTLVEFHLESVEGHTRVRVVESGFLSLPGMSDQTVNVAIENMGKGWALMLGALAQHLRPLDEGPSIQIPADPDSVYEALLDPGRWWAEAVDGTVGPGASAVLDFGTFGRMRVEVIEADRPTLLCWHQQREGEEERTSVTFQLHATGEGSHLQVDEQAIEGVLENARRRQSRQVWGIVLGMLKMHFTSS